VRPRTWIRLLGTTGALLLTSCLQSQHRTTATVDQVQTLDHRSPFLKVHMRDGRAYVLNPWRVDASARAVAGTGRLLDPDRRIVRDSAAFTIPLDSVALFETNVLQTSGASTALTVFVGITAAVTVYCIANPKACFGSCPTFYVSDGTSSRLMAEGFSASVAPALEATDIDALYRARPASRDLEVRMTNEALETHVVRSVRVLAAPRPAGGRVFATDAGAFWRATAVREPSACRAAEGDCLAALRAFDGQERFSTTDSADLGVRETVELEFARPAGARDLGLVMASRQTLLSTYLLYQGLAFMGRRAGDWLAVPDRVRPMARAFDVLGTIEVEVQDDAGAWRAAGRTMEPGPIATDVHLVPLPRVAAGPVRIRLRLTRGAWRLDWAALAVLEGQVEPLRLDPVGVRRGSLPDPGALAALREGSRPLVTFPGDTYTLAYRLPEDYAGHELFLESRGYYLEWMREEWLAEEDSARAGALLVDPARTLRALAPGFKRQEAAMEAAFWGSRYERP
jgi:hypothetical protein